MFMRRGLLSTYRGLSYCVYTASSRFLLQISFRGARVENNLLLLGGPFPSLPAPTCSTTLDAFLFAGPLSPLLDISGFGL